MFQPFCLLRLMPVSDEWLLENPLTRITIIRVAIATCLSLYKYQSVACIVKSMVACVMLLLGSGAQPTLKAGTAPAAPLVLHGVVGGGDHLPSGDPNAYLPRFIYWFNLVYDNYYWRILTFSYIREFVPKFILLRLRNFRKKESKVFASNINM